MHTHTMNLPPTWRSAKRTAQPPDKEPDTKTRNVRRRTSDMCKAANDHVVSEDVLQQVRNHVHNCDGDPTHEELNLGTILSGISYKQIIEEVYANNGMETMDVPLVTKAYEESFMRESANNTEKQCSMMHDCECTKIDAGNQFIGTEFLLPGESTTSEARMCVLCQRQLTQKMFFDLMYDGKSFRFPIQRYGSICETPNEYSKEVMLFCPTNGPVHSMPYPSVSHQRNRYSVCTNYGARFLKQHRVAFEEFQTVGCPPPCMRVCASTDEVVPRRAEGPQASRCNFPTGQCMGQEGCRGRRRVGRSG